MALETRLAVATLVAGLTACGVDDRNVNLKRTPDAGGPDAASDGGASGSGASMSGKGGSSASGGAVNQGGTGAAAGRAGGAGGGGAVDGGGAAGAETGGAAHGGANGGGADGGTEAGVTCSGALTACGRSCVNVTGNDPANCGACEHSCQNTAAGACVAGRCKPFVLDTTTGPISLAVDELKVFWQEKGGAVLTDSTAGGAKKNFYVAGNAVTNSFCSSPASCSTNIAADAINVYWPEQTTAPPNPIVQSNTLGGNSAYAYGSTQNSAALYTFVMPDATDVYAIYTSFTTQGGNCPSMGVEWMTISPRSRTTTNWKIPAFCRMSQMALDATNLYWTDLGSPNGYTAPGVFMAPKKGTTSKLIEGASIPTGIALYNGVLYWTDTGTGAIKRWTGSGMPTTLSTSSAPGWLAVDSSGVYWIDANKTILHAPLTGSNVTAQTLAASQTNATAIATNSTAVFWITAGTAAMSFADGAVMKLAK